MIVGFHPTPHQRNFFEKKSLWKPQKAKNLFPIPFGIGNFFAHFNVFLFFENILLIFDKNILTTVKSCVIMQSSKKINPKEEVDTMNKKKLSLYASIVMTALVTALIIIAVIILPALISLYENLRGGIDCRDLMTALYISALPGLVCTVALMKLLLNICKDEIFTGTNVTILRILSYCCIFVGVEYLVFAHRYISMLLIAFVALFFGLILRVIKNVFEKAIIIREENDFTI